MQTKRHIRALFLTSLCMVLSGSPGAVFGRTFYVDSAASGRQDGASWLGAFKYLQDALAMAVTGDEIRVAQGHYRPDQGLCCWASRGNRKAAFRLLDSATALGGFGSLAYERETNGHCLARLGNQPSEPHLGPHSYGQPGTVGRALGGWWARPST